jgi:hemerythrin
VAHWNPPSPIGVEELDAQHRRFFEHGEALEEAVANGEARHRVEGMLHFLLLYAEEHFRAEERLMDETQYPEAAAHSRDHADFRRRLRSLVPVWESDGDSPALLLALVGFLRFWQVDHVSSRDGHFGEYLASHGIPLHAVDPGPAGMGEDGNGRDDSK